MNINSARKPNKPNHKDATPVVGLSSMFEALGA